MIIKGTSRSGPSGLATHLGNEDTNEQVQLLETRGTVADDLRGALIEMDSFALGTQCKKSLYHAAISPEPPHRLTRDQRFEAVTALEEKLGFTGHARVVVLHEKQGRQHLHVVWSRIDLARMTSVSDSHNYRKHEEVARHLERRFGHEKVQGAHVERRGTSRPPRSPSRAELRQEERTGISSRRVRAEVTAAFRGSRGPEQFRVALERGGYALARGDRRDYVIVDKAGGIHSLARRIEGIKTAELRVFMAGIVRQHVPTVAMARASVPTSGRSGPRFPTLRQERKAAARQVFRRSYRLHLPFVTRSSFRACASTTTAPSSRSTNKWRYARIAKDLTRRRRRRPTHRQPRRIYIPDGKKHARLRLRRRRPPPIIENELMKPMPRRGRGPMSMYELICWHRANGTLDAFLASIEP